MLPVQLVVLITVMATTAAPQRCTALSAAQAKFTAQASPALALTAVGIVYL